MNRGLLSGALLLASLTAGLPAAAESGVSAITWQACPEFSDEDLREQNLKEEQFAEFRRLLARTDCGTIRVPQNYDEPRGKQITVALTRLRASDRKNRLGSIALNPGGPGGSGYLMPLHLVMRGAKGLDERHDLIGVDPRGVGRSTKVSCPDIPRGTPSPGPITEAHARQAYAAMVDWSEQCVRRDPAFLRQLTTPNVARDIDRIRAALGERKIGFFGVSWGTWLGAVMRTMYPARMGRMWLDSVVPPRSWQDFDTNVQANAADRNFRRMAAWMAERHDTYGLGTSERKVVSAVEDMVRRYDREPLSFTDIDLTVDGGLVSRAAGRPSGQWPRMAQVLKELADATGPQAPPAVKEAFGRPEGGGGGGDTGTDRTAGRAYHCNEDPTPSTIESSWKDYQQRLKRYPVTGRTANFVHMCAGWPLPAKTPTVRPTGTSLMLSGHRYETVTPYEWARAMRAAIGGTLVSIDDDVHGSAAQVPGCAAKVIAYFETGRRTTTCPGKQAQQTL
ncbi:alpha/beta fold hydrolase [Nonomuraea mesophila]|uniref:Alpha/beta fold hydrolase n=1 Tax=Nonomuraea mesophila TaxID=2530382 RepID=A0A4R5FVP7_9ACTN|nr:alpha/beta fold hydrolase [Nonomuraea mesophila]